MIGKAKFIVETPDEFMYCVPKEGQEGTLDELVKELKEQGVYEFKVYQAVAQYTRKVELEEVKLDG